MVQMGHLLRFSGMLDAHILRGRPRKISKTPFGNGVEEASALGQRSRALRTMIPRLFPWDEALYSIGLLDLSTDLANGVVPWADLKLALDPD